MERAESKFNYNNTKLVLTLLLLLLTISLLLIPLTSAAQIDFTKDSDSFNKGETLIAKVSANFVELPTRDNIFFYRNGAHTNIPFDYDVLNIKGDFYVYALLAEKQAGNYSLSIENVKYMKGALESEEDLVKNFTITENTSDFSVTPGFIDGVEDFSLEVQNLQDKEIKITISTSKNLSAPSSLNLKSGEIKEIEFLYSGEGFVSENIKLSSSNTEYLIPTFVDSYLTSGSGNTSSGSDTTSSEEGFRFEPNIVSVSMATNSTAKRVIYVLNTGETELKNLTFFVPILLKPYVKISAPSKINENSTEQVEITIQSGSLEKFVEDKITARVGNGSLTSSFEISLDFISDYVPSSGEELGEEPVVLTTCAQLPRGIICTTNETCSGETAKVSGGVCCLGTCEVVKKSSTGKIIGWSLVVLVVLFLFWFFKKYKHVRPQVDLLKIGAKK